MFLKKHQCPPLIHAAVLSSITKQLKIKQAKFAVFLSDFSSSALISPTQVYHQHYFFL